MSASWDEIIRKETKSDAEKAAIAAVLEVSESRGSHLTKAQIFDRLVRMYNWLFIEGAPGEKPRFDV